MYVSAPFKAQNVKNYPIDPSELFLSYLNKILLDSEEMDSLLKLHLQAIGDKIGQFHEAIANHSLKKQKLASKHLKNYNCNCE